MESELFEERHVLTAVDAPANALKYFDNIIFTILRGKNYVDRKTHKWIGGVEVIRRSGNIVLDTHEAGAFVIVLALARDPAEYQKRVAEAANALGLDLLQCDEIELLSDRLSRYEVELSVRELGDHLSPSNSVLFDIFRTYPFGSDKQSYE